MKNPLILIGGLVAYLSSCAVNLVQYEEKIQEAERGAEIYALADGNRYEVVTSVNVHGHILRRTDYTQWKPMLSEFREVNGLLELIVFGESDSLSFSVQEDSLMLNGNN